MATMVDTYLRINNDFVSLREFNGKLPDKDYIEGAIVCRINDRDIFTTDHWDLIDQLWAYVVSGLSKVVQGEDYDSYFPDQPIRLRFEPISARCVKVTIGDQSLKLDLPLFLSVMQRGAIEFFSKMKNLNPDAREVWEKYEKEAESLTA
jgi:hypothetical protein